MPEKDDIALSVKGLSKDFLLPHERKNSIKELVLHFSKPSYEHMHALKNIDFEVKRGEFFGIVGRNGSGKSTLLKLIGGIYQPTKGSITVNGTLTPFIELGIGFNPELTGRENVYLNGAILGLTRKEVEAKYEEIVEFAELERFMDQKLKNYSSGMQVRLAFSIAMQAHNDILLIDEVLAVGDANFQRKCFVKFNEIKKQGKTVIFVTHDMSAVQQYCDRAMMIQDAELLMIGKPREVALRYEVANAKTTSEEKSGDQQSARPKNPTVQIKSIKLFSHGKAQERFTLRDQVEAVIRFNVRQPQEIQFNLFFVDDKGRYVAGINTTVDLPHYLPGKGEHEVTCTIQPGQLDEGNYRVNTALYGYCEWPSAETPELIDILDASYGAPTPVMRIIENSPVHNGGFNLASKWDKD